MTDDPGPRLTHIDQAGQASMVDVGDKEVSVRIAEAEGFVFMKGETLDLIAAGDTKKGDVVGISRIAGIMAAKRTHELVPLCHPLLLDKIGVEIELRPDLPGLRVTGLTRVWGRTGVEMEALTAVSVACLTIYDMAKAVDRTMSIGGIRLLSKSGGRSGDFHAGPPVAVDDARDQKRRPT